MARAYVTDARREVEGEPPRLVLKPYEKLVVRFEDGSKLEVMPGDGGTPGLRVMAMPGTVAVRPHVANVVTIHAERL